MNFLGFGQSAEIDIIFDGAETRKSVEVKGEDGKMEKLFLYYDGETVSGKVNVTLKKPGSKLEHQGIKIEFIGQIELFYDRGNHHEFKGIVKALARPGDLIQNTSYPFEFPNVEKSFETYAGSNVRLRYFLRATIVRRISDITREVDIAVHTLCSYPDLNNPIKMEVGIEDCLHIEFEYNKSKYHLKDVIVGKIYFLLVRIKIKHMEIAIIKRESTGSGPNMFTENETIAKYEIMDGAPVKGESIPIRVFLAGYSLTPTMRDINKKFSVKYFLNLVLMDTEDRRYFKQQEITLWRKADKTRKSQSIYSSNHPNAPTHLVGGHDSDLQTRYGIVGSMTNASSGQGAASGDSNVTIDDDINSGEGRNDDDIGQHGTDATESTMGLFIRESPQQEYAQHEDSPTSPRSTNISVGGRRSAEMLRGTADGAASNSAQTDGGGGGGATATAAAVAASSGPALATPTTTQSASQFIFESQSAVMVSTTPPPLPVTVTATTLLANENGDGVKQQQQQQSTLTKAASRAAESPNVPSPANTTNDIMEEEMINVPLNAASFASTTIIQRKSHGNEEGDESDE